MCQKGLANLFLTFTQPIFGNHDCRRHVGIPEAKKAWHVAQQPQTVVWLPSMPTEHFYTVDACAASAKVDQLCPLYVLYMCENTCDGEAEQQHNIPTLNKVCNKGSTEQIQVNVEDRKEKLVET